MIWIWGMSSDQSSWFIRSHYICRYSDDCPCNTRDGRFVKMYGTHGIGGSHEWNYEEWIGSYPGLISILGFCQFSAYSVNCWLLLMADKYDSNPLCPPLPPHIKYFEQNSTPVQIICIVQDKKKTILPILVLYQHW